MLGGYTQKVQQPGTKHLIVHQWEYSIALHKKNQPQYVQFNKTMESIVLLTIFLKQKSRALLLHP